jgi:hypothetical protein
VAGRAVCLPTILEQRNKHMKDLIEALIIFAKYASDDHNPTNCEHDEFLVYAGITKDMVSPEDKKRLGELDFFWSDDLDCWKSFRFGSC